MLYKEKAKKFAYKAHKGQLRKDGVAPYIEHPKAVVGILKSVGVNNDSILSAAWLHDVVEDCGIKLETVRNEFGDNIARLVDGMTQNKGVESKKAYRARIINNSDDVKLIKLSDTLHNIMTTYNIVPAKRMKVYKSMTNNWNAYKSFAYKVNFKLASMIERELKKLQKQLGGEKMSQEIERIIGGAYYGLQEGVYLDGKLVIVKTSEGGWLNNRKILDNLEWTSELKEKTLFFTYVGSGIGIFNHWWSELLAIKEVISPNVFKKKLEIWKKFVAPYTDYVNPENLIVVGCGCNAHKDFFIGQGHCYAQTPKCEASYLKPKLINAAKQYFLEERSQIEKLLEVK